MRFAAVVVLDADVVAHGVDEACLPIAGVVHRIVNGDDILELRRADLADALESAQRVGVRCAGGIEEGLFVEAGRLDHQRVALEVPDRVAVIERPGQQLLLARHRLVHRDQAELVAELVDDGDLAGRPVDDLERIRIRQDARQPIGYAEPARVVDHRPRP